jgi:tungstate transport system ATP-binding protein
MKPPILAATQVSLLRQGQAILEQINYEFAAGQVYAVIGPNGAGKSSLLRLLGLLEKPSQGRIVFQGTDTTACWPDCLELRRQIGLVHQDPVRFQGTVFQNIALGLKFRRLPRPRIKERVREILTDFDLTDLGPRSATTLSQGEAQKMALARVMAFSPQVLLLDEPTASLDPRNTQECENLITKINRGWGKTIILVTHDLGQAERVSQQILFMHHGRIQETGPTAELIASPQNEQTKSFLARKIIL